MGRCAGALLVFLAVAGPAAAGPGYDVRLADAAARIVAENIGPLEVILRRGEPRRLFDNAPRSPAAAHRAAAPRPGQWRRGLALAVDARRTVSPEL